MSQARTRTLKLKLSNFGADQFLRSHSRLALLTSRFIPYGMTLWVGVRMLAEAGSDALQEELASPMIARILGDLEYFVGASDSMRQLCGHLLAEQEWAAGLQKKTNLTMIYAASISTMMVAEDAAFLRNYKRQQ